MNVFGLDVCTVCIPIIIATLTVGFVTLLIALRFYVAISCGVCKNNRTMEGKTIIITGANGGIGKETARDLARRKARVIMACRNLETAEAARKEISEETGNNDIIVKKLDLGSLQSVRDFAADILKTEERIDILIHNAGMALAFKGATSVDGIELTMATNHYGPFLLTHLLIDKIKASTPARIVIVASELYRLASVNVNKLNPVGSFPAAYLYYVSKYANIYFARELARRLDGTGVTVNSLHPGMIDSGIWRNVPFPLNYPMMAITKGFFKTTKQGAQTTLHVATDPELENVSGKYYMDCKERGLSNAAQDMEKARKIWEESIKLVKLTDSDPKI
ncbi:retinol dehydrogenase 14 [Condylostylus longicornis]|uniref:retinol dehydrogenase 14 n=1 Tax=Condylostylus longicornis TaxID=2530218 RepID=UPI00244E10BC|nr:retinol dehydrogenase 14 [Condylostylus longicornis]XP_055379178.1 retinol dehydrogenase 14 [Condylostylus longicornis]XP_055379179.1 retinol dehydrogenase 14 [Condylostylus longicornis]